MPDLFENKLIKESDVTSDSFIKDLSNYEDFIFHIPAYNKIFTNVKVEIDNIHRENLVSVISDAKLLNLMFAEDPNAKDTENIKYVLLNRFVDWYNDKFVPKLEEGEGEGIMLTIDSLSDLNRRSALEEYIVKISKFVNLLEIKEFKEWMSTYKYVGVADSILIQYRTLISKLNKLES